MDFDTTTLLDCGHVGQPAGVCQYAADGEQGCADRVCSDCIAVCDTCRSVLCPRHSTRLDDDNATYCQDHVTGAIVRTLISAVLDR